MPEQHDPAILLLHDGELEDVRTLLVSLGAEPVCQRSNERVAAAAGTSWDLIVSTSRRALAHPDCLTGGDLELPPPRVVFANEDSATLRSQLRAAGFDYLVRRPVDPEALRLLLLRLLYQGPERRRIERYPSGREIVYHLGSRARSALLGDLSESGCRLLHAAQATEGQRIVVDVPVDEGGHATMAVPGTVLRVVPPGAPGDGSTLAVTFDELDDLSLERLRESLRTSIIGSASASRSTPEGSNRRREQRGAFRKRVVALRAEADRVLIGCDLSASGMRVDSHPSLAIGDRLRLAIYAEAGAQPWLVDATVIRNEQDSGLALLFHDVAPDLSRRLEAFVASLPPLEPLQRGEIGSLGAVLTQILE